MDQLSLNLCDIVDTFCLSSETVKTAVKIKRFCPFWNLLDVFQNRGLTLETSDFDFCNLLDEFFHMTQKHFFEKKIKVSKVILKSHITKIEMNILSL